MNERNPTYVTPRELANILDLVSKVSVPIGVAITQIAPVLQRASMLASLPEGTRIGAIVEPKLVPETIGNEGGGAPPAQLELPFGALPASPYIH